MPDAYSIGPFYGEAHEAKDYQTARDAYGGGIAGEDYTYLQFTLQGTKIGGYRSPIQSTEDPVDATWRANALSGCPWLRDVHCGTRSPPGERPE